MKAKSHHRIARASLPHLPADKIRRINRRIDSGNSGINPLSRGLTPESGGKVPGLSYRGHRRFGHDISTALSIGFEEAGLEGMLVAAEHLGLDLLRDQIASKLGASGADFLEGLCNFGFELVSKKRARGRKESTRDKKNKRVTHRRNG